VSIAEYPNEIIAPIPRPIEVPPTPPKAEAIPDLPMAPWLFWLGCATMLANVALFAIWLNHVLRLESL
jgi:hypothetical protein